MFINILFYYLLLSELFWIVYYFTTPEETGQADRTPEEFIAGLIIIPLVLPIAIITKLLKLN